MSKIDWSSVLGIITLVIGLYNTYGHGRNGGAIAGLQSGLGILLGQQQQSNAQQQQAAVLNQIALQTPVPAVVQSSTTDNASRN